MVRPVKRLDDSHPKVDEQTQVSAMIKLVAPVLKGETKKVFPWQKVRFPQEIMRNVWGRMKEWRLDWSLWRPRLIKCLWGIIVINILLWGWGWMRQGYQARMIVQTEGHELNQAWLKRYHSIDMKRQMLARLYQWPAWVEEQIWLANFMAWVDRQEIALKPVALNLVELSVKSKTPKQANHLLTLVYQDYLHQWQNNKRQGLLAQQQQLMQEQEKILKTLHQQLDDLEALDWTKRLWSVSASIDQRLSSYVDNKKAELAGLILNVQEKYLNLEHQIRALREQKRLRWMNQGNIAKRIEFQESLQQLTIMEIHRFAMTEDLMNAYQQGVKEARDLLMAQVKALAQTPEQVQAMDIYGQWLLWRSQYEALQVVANQRWVVGMVDDDVNHPWVVKWKQIRSEWAEYDKVQQQLKEIQAQMAAVGKEKVTINSPVKVDRL